MINFIVYKLRGLELHQESRLQVPTFCDRPVRILGFVKTRISSEGKSAYCKFLNEKEQNNFFNQIKRCLVKKTLLNKLDPNNTLILTTDASSVGVGAVLLHRLPDESERPISHASKTLSDQQRKYSQMKREGMAIIYGLKMFHQYLYGYTFEIITDN
ncbi:Retrovirus-related Pol polyprotein [Thelohanellus kitauei]|uniref:Retrovirus-related Pol polyprotein n=1 Tax=Thelohanellus kitauei TaxID=669202 RepID=A0A0C2MEI3_THEKT|nr:Retrovirus-related Pol polyprotein [Thelohanellus kitauei]